jgi:hypothetical protein
MDNTKHDRLKKIPTYALVLVLWIITAWLLYPLITLDTVEMDNAKEYLYRSAFGIALMIIFFGKTTYDILFPQVTYRKMPLLNTILLSIYAFLLAGGIIFMALRMIVLYLRSREGGLLF